MVRRLKFLESNSGSAIVSALVVSGIVLAGVVTSFQYVGMNMQKSISSAQKTTNSSEDLAALLVLSGKVQLKKADSTGIPKTEWAPEFYPDASELNDRTFKPYFTALSSTQSSFVPNLRVDGTSEGGTCHDLPGSIDRVNSDPQAKDCKLTRFQLDGSKLGSLEKPEDLKGWTQSISRRKQEEEQKGFIGYAALSSLDSRTLNSYLSQRNDLLPNSAVRSKPIIIHRFLQNSADPLIVSGIEVTVGTTRAQVPINPPPQPSCQLKTSIAPRGQSCYNQTSYIPATVTTQQPRNSITVLRCSPNPGSPYLPLYPAVGSCPSGQALIGSITFYRTTTPIYHVNLGPRPGYFNQRGWIYATNLAGEQLGQDELNGAGTYPISFNQLLQELGQPTTESVTQNVTNSVTNQVCKTIETPECSGDCVELGGNRGVTAHLYVDSVSSVAEVSGDSFHTSQNFSLGRYPLANLGKFNLDQPPVGTATVLPPANLYALQPPQLWENPDGSKNDSYGMWIVNGRVSGLSRASVSQTCSTKFKVFPPPPPKCTADAVKDNILSGQATTVVLTCQGSSKITSAQIVGGNTFPLTTFTPSFQSSANYKITRTAYVRKSLVGPETINIKINGPGGETVVTTELDAVCPYNSPTKVYTSAYGRVFRRLRWTTPSFDTYEEPSYIPPGTIGPNAHVCENSNFCMISWVPGGDWGWHWPHYVKIGPKTDDQCKVLEYAIRSDGCFTGDTLIRMANGSEKAVSKLKENDYVFNPLFQTPVRISKLVKGPESKALFQIIVGRNKLKVTEDHPFLTQRGWLTAKELKSKDWIMGEKQFKQVSSAKKLPYTKPVDVYNFELDTNVPEGHIILANKIPTGDLVTQKILKQQNKPMP